MTEITKEIRLKYQNSIGIEGVKKHYENLEKCEKYEGIALRSAWAILLFAAIRVFCVYFAKPSSALPVCSFLATLSLFLFAIIFVLYYAKATIYMPKESACCIYLTELIEKEGFSYVTASVALNEKYLRYFIIRSYDEDGNLPNSNPFLSPIEIANPNDIADDYEFTGEHEPELVITKHDWKLYFPKKELKSISFK